MSLDWNVSKIKDYEEVCYIKATQDAPNHGIVKGDRLLNPVTNVLIWQSMVTGLDRSWYLTEEFAPEFYARIQLLEKLSGPFLRGPEGEHRGITWQDVQRHIGLHTNVGTVTRAAFIKNVVTYELDDVKRYAELVKASPLPA